MPERSVLRLACVVFFMLAVACHPSPPPPAAGKTLFSLQPSAVTGITFNNRVTDSREMNIFNYHNFYNGGGVAIGDVNNDGRPDIFFTSNQGKNRLYLNKGNWQFDDVTDSAGISSSHHWHTGVTMVDINGDGWLDIYVCNSGMMPEDDRANELYINQRNGTFKEEAHAYGLDDNGESIQAVFFDYDHDGDLDCFVLNNSHRSIESFGYNSKLRNIRDANNGDRLYRNDGGRFTNVTEQAGIFGSEIGFGLSVAVGDLDNDGWDDMYVCNDFFERDYLYMNNHDGTFREVINDAMGHISNGSMGSDMADINNDGYLDLFTAEMLPENDYRLKTTLKFDEYDVQNARNRLDFHHQFTGNCLQLNNQNGTFSEIAQLAGVDATGWSWSALDFDFDNDGWKDIYVCNGLSKDLTDQDFLEFVSSKEVVNQGKTGQLDFNAILQKMPSVPLPNYGFVNERNLRFKNQSVALGFATPSFSNGAAYADLDGDGDLDLVVSNENMEAFVYRNNASEQLHHHYLKVKLAGATPNVFGYGARVEVFTKDNHQLIEQMPTRGFQSSVDPVLNFGIGTNTSIDSVQVKWGNDSMQTIRNIAADTLLQLYQSNARQRTAIPTKKTTLYSNATAATVSGAIMHHENEYTDFDIERLMPKMLSTEGPKLAVADVNGDGLEDFYMGSAMDDTAKLFIQQPNGHFIQQWQKAFIQDRQYENTGAVFFDADGDGDLDLAVTAGGNQARLGSPYLLARLYLNNGKGNFTRSTTGWPTVSVNASCIRAGDFNGDGKEDLFIGARNVPGSYGIIPASVLLQNNGGGNFTDVTRQVAPDLLQLGMVTDAQWADVDHDGKKELVVVGDWMPVTILKYINGKLQIIRRLPHSSGWWNCLSVEDLDGDGYPDLIAGNNGLNTRIRASTEQPAALYVDDFDKNGQTECIPVYYKTDGRRYPYFLKGEIEMQLPMLKKKFLHFSDYAGKTINEIFTTEQLAHASVLQAEQDQTCIFMNDGKGNFSMQPLPVMAQLSPVYAVAAADLNGDGRKDLFLAGNFYGLKPQTGRFDASYGTTLLAGADHRFVYLPPTESGLFVNGEARDIKIIPATGRNSYIVVAMNHAPLYLFRRQISGK